jgi:hypothetical protein
MADNAFVKTGRKTFKTPSRAGMSTEAYGKYLSDVEEYDEDDKEEKDDKYEVASSTPTVKTPEPQKVDNKKVAPKKDALQVAIELGKKIVKTVQEKKKKPKKPEPKQRAATAIRG